jgi:cellulose biosynthesis protein BcsQ
MREQFGDLVFDTVIRRSIVYPESARAAKPIFDYRKRKSVDYSRLTVEVLERLDYPAALERARHHLAEVEPKA